MAHTFFRDVRELVRRGELLPHHLAEEESWLREELQRLQTCLLDCEKATTLRSRIRKHAGPWRVSLDVPRVPPTNNLAERALRPLVVLRKIVLGHGSQAGAKRMATVISIQETANRHRRQPTAMFYRLYTDLHNRVLRYLYAGRRRS